MTQNRLFDTLAESHSRNELLLILGAGLASDAGLPGWLQLVQPMAEALGQSWPNDSTHITADLLLQTTESFANQKDRTTLIRIIKEQIGTRSLEPSDSHRLIAHIAQSCMPVVFSAYYDDLLDQALDAARVLYNPVATKESLSVSGHDRVLVIKLVGDPVQPESIVVTKSDFDTYAEKHHHWLDQLSLELQRKTTLLLGFVPSDPFFRIFDPVWAHVRSNSGGLQHHVYALTAGLSHSATDSLEQRSIRTINLEIQAGKSAGNVLQVWLGALWNEIEARRKKVGGPRNPGSAVKLEPSKESTEVLDVLPSQWLPGIFKYPPFSAIRAEDDIYLSRYFLAMAEFQQIREPATGTAIVYGGAGQGKSAMARILHESCQETLRPSSSQHRILTIPLDDFDYLAHSSPADLEQPEIHTLYLLKAAGRALWGVTQQYPELSDCLDHREKQELERLLEQYADQRGVQEPHSSRSHSDLIAGVQRFDRSIESLGIAYAYVLVDRVDEYNADDDTVVKAMEAFISSPTLIDTFQFRFFLPTRYRDLLVRSPGLQKRLHQIKKYNIEWQEQNLRDMLFARLGRSTEERVYSFKGLMDFPLISPGFDADQIIVEYAYGSPRHLVLLGDRIIREHRRSASAEKDLIAPETFERAVRSFARECAEEAYGKDHLDRITRIERYPLTFESLYEVMQSNARMKHAEKTGLVRQEWGTRRQSRYFIPDPRVRLCCRACTADQAVFSIKN